MGYFIDWKRITIVCLRRANCVSVQHATFSLFLMFNRFAEVVENLKLDQINETLVK